MSGLKSIAWCIAYRTRNNDNAVFHVLENPIWGWAADPFMIKVEGVVYLFAELWDYKKGKGGLGYTIIEKNRKADWHMVIEEEYHLSYPHFVKMNGVLYICPESCNDKTVYFYKCIRFPDEWEKQPPFIKNMDCSDTTFYQCNESLYGFTCLYHEKPIKLIAFKYENNQVEFSEKNPIYEGGVLARPGGAIFEENGKLIRVSQDCTEYYGKALVFSELEIHWPDISEKVIRTISIDDFKFDKGMNPIGIHTYNRCDDLEVVDLKLNGVNLVNVFFRIVIKIKKRLHL